MAQERAKNALKTQNTRKPARNRQETEEDDDFNRRALMQIVETQNLKPLNEEDVDEMERRFNNYLKYYTTKKH